MSKAENETLFCAVDGSASSLRALEYAVDLATRASLALEIVSVIDVGDLELMSELGFALPEAQLNEAQLKTEASVKGDVQALLDKRGFKDFSLEFSYGRPLPRVMERAESKAYYGVVLGRTGKGALETMLKGSVAREMSSHCKRPVTIVP